MPRPTDPLIREEILTAAEELLDQGSATAITMRAISEKTGIAVTTIYERFGDRERLLRELAYHLSEVEARKVEQFTKLDEMLLFYFRYAEENPSRYELLAETFFERLEGDGVPGYSLLKQRLAETLGGAPEDHEELAMGVLALLVGTVKGIMIVDESSPYREKIVQAAISTLRLILAAKQQRIAVP